MKKNIIIINFICLLCLSSCRDGFDEEVFNKYHLEANGNKIIKTECLYGDKGGIKRFLGTLLSNDGSMYFYGQKGLSSDRRRGLGEEWRFNNRYMIGRINELGNIAWEKAFNQYSWIGGIVQNNKDQIYAYGQKYGDDNKYCKYIAHISKNGTIKELDLNNLPTLYIIYSMEYIVDDLFLAIGRDEDENNYLMVLNISITTVEVVQSINYGNNNDWVICYVEQQTTDSYEAVLTCENERPQLMARKVKISNATISTLWEQTITSNIMQNPASTLASHLPYSNHQAIKIDNEICITGYGENDIEHSTSSGDMLWDRALIANLNYNTGKINWLKTIPFRNTSVTAVRAESILYADNSFYVIGRYSEAVFTSNNNQGMGYGFVQKVDRNGNLSDVQIFGEETQSAKFYDGIILNRNLFLFGSKGRYFELDFPYSNLTVNSQASQAWFVKCSINDF